MFLKVFAPAVVLSLASSLALACPGKPDCKDGQCKLKNDIAKVLELDSERAEQVREMQKAHKKARRELRTEQHEQLKTLRGDHKAELATILSAEELAKFDKVMAERKAHHSHKGGHSHKEGGHGSPKQCAGKDKHKH